MMYGKLSEGEKEIVAYAELAHECYYVYVDCEFMGDDFRFYAKLHNINGVKHMYVECERELIVINGRIGNMPQNKAVYKMEHGSTYRTAIKGVFGTIEDTVMDYEKRFPVSASRALD